MSGDEVAALWKRAISQYQEATGHDPCSFNIKQAPSINDVMNFTVEKEGHFKKWRSDGASGKTSKFREVLKATLRPIDRLGSFVGSCASMTAHSVSADYDTLLDFFEELKSFLERLKVLNGHIRSSPEIEECLVEILGSILILIGLSSKEMKRGRGLKFLKNLVNDKDDDIASAYNRLRKEWRTQTTKHTQADDLEKLNLHLKPQPVTDYDTNTIRLVKNTATWLLNEPDFISWVNSEKPVLWISGGPGCGKSHLSTMAIKHLFDKIHRDGTFRSSVGYYYFHDDDQQKRSFLNAITAMVYQVAKGDEVYCMHAANTCKYSASISDATIRSVWKDFIATEYGPMSSGQLYLIFDGVDEAKREDVEEFISILSDSIQNRLRVQVLLVGRPEMDGIVSFADLDESSVPTIRVSSQKNSQDIAQYINYKYDHTPKIPKLKAVKQKVFNALLENADGMFLWVDLMFAELSYRSQPKQILQALQTLPKGLLGLYQRIFTRIEKDVTIDDEETLQQLKELFCWTAHSKKPLSLFTLNQRIQLTTSSEMFDTEIAIQTHCSSLLKLTKTGEALFDDLVSNLTLVESSQGITTMESVDTDIPDHETSDDELDMDEEDRRIQRYQKDVFVHLRHASLGDYLRTPKLKDTKLLMDVKTAQVHTLLCLLRTVCKGSEAPLDAWLDATGKWLALLEHLDEHDVSDEDTKLIVEHIVEIFTSEPLLLHIAENSRSILFDEDGDQMIFGFNMDLQHKNRVSVEKWFRKAVAMKSTVLKATATAWVNEVLERPLGLLIPLTKACIHEWLRGTEEAPFELYWKARFCWVYLLSTDLVPPFADPGLPDHELFDFQPPFVPTNNVEFLANISDEERSWKVDCRIAKTMAFVGLHDEATLEYHKAIEIAQQENSKEALKSIYLEWALSMTEGETSRGCGTRALIPIKSYIALDESNHKAYVCLGKALVANGDVEQAMEAYKKALSLDQTDCVTIRHIFNILLNRNNPEGVMELIEVHGPKAAGFWVRGHSDIGWFHEIVFWAAWQTGKLELVKQIYEDETRSKSIITTGYVFSPNDDMYRVFFDPTLAAMVSSFFRCLLALLCRKYSGEPDMAFDLLKTAFFTKSGFFKLSTSVNSSFGQEYIPAACEQFAELIHDKALRPNGTVDTNMITMLESLIRRDAVYRKLDHIVADINDRKPLPVVLASLYMKSGRIEQAFMSLNETFQRAIELLKDDIDWNDEFAYHVICKILFLCGQIDKAKVALFLKRYALDDFAQLENQENPEAEEDNGNKVGKETGEDKEAYHENETSAPDAGQQDSVSEDDSPPQAPPVQKLRWKCSRGLGFCQTKELGYRDRMYTCMDCINVEFCEECYVTLMKEETAVEDTKRLYVCNPNHQLLSTPIEGFERFDKDNGRIELSGGTAISVTEWLAVLQKEWDSGSYFKD
ncbi:hypothetical protein K440DRAFT_638823 [Wilcoxina mikolae CBS 423.85]|nr:hypothetical protein K440DRAFT_638823 [Wilcoxina mikolae CBS 423.85]